MNPLRKAAAGPLLVLLLTAHGCGPKPADRAAPEPEPKPQARRVEPPAKAPGTGRSAAPTPAAVPAVEVRYTGDDFADVAAGDGVALRATCAGVESSRVLLLDARRHPGPGGARPGVTAPELHAAYAADADRRFRTKGVVVRGVVVTAARGRLELSPTAEPTALKPDGRPDLSAAKPDLTLTAEQYHQALKPDVPAARQKFDGKVIEVSGVVRRFASERGRASVLLAAGPGQAGIFPEVRCYTRDDQPWATLVPEQKVTLRGVRPLALAGPTLVDCAVVGSEPAKPVTVTASDLAAGYKASRDRTNDRFAGKLIYVTGEVSGTRTDSGGGVRVALKVEPDLPPVVLEFGANNEDYAASDLRSGAKVRACGKFFGNYDPAEVKLSDALFVFE